MKRQFDFFPSIKKCSYVAAPRFKRRAWRWWSPAVEQSVIPGRRDIEKALRNLKTSVASGFYIAVESGRLRVERLADGKLRYGVQR